MRRKRGIAASAGGALVLAACAAPDIAPPPVSPPDAPAAYAIAKPGPVSIDLATYWQVLGDPLLDEFVQQAIAENQDLAQSAARVVQAEASLRAARAGYLPTVNATGGVGRNVGTNAPDDFNFSVGADAAWEADLFGRVRYGVDASEAELAAAGYSLADVQRLIVGQVALATVRARSNAAQLAIARDTLANQEENLQIARWRNQAGLVSSLDVEQARAQRAQTAATIPSLEAALAANANAIATLIGEPPGRTLSALQSNPGVPRPPLLTGTGLPAELLTRRPDIRAAEAALVADSARIGVARAQLLPLVRLTGNLGTGGLGIGSLFDTLTGNLFAGISQLLFDGGRTRAQVDIAQGAAQGSLAAWRQQVLVALEEVETASADLSSGRSRVGLFDEARDAAQNAALLARSQYQAGLVDFQTLLTAEQQLLSSRNAVITAETERATAFVRLTQALGGGWTPATYPLPVYEVAETR